MEELQQLVNKFVSDRDWDQFHAPVHLAKSIVIESAELLECFQWDNDHFDYQHVKEELADVMIYCLQMCDKLNVKADDIIKMKMKMNEEKYPVEKAKGKSDKYNEL
nr:nucleotide pyrophosphohydrolase [Kandleria vitulina]